MLQFYYIQFGPERRKTERVNNIPAKKKTKTVGAGKIGLEMGPN